MDNLKPCPCCGSEDVHFNSTGAYIWCRRCGIQTAMHANRYNSMAKWNNRTALSTIDPEAIPLIHGRAELDAHDEAIRRECADRAVVYCAPLFPWGYHGSYSAGLRAAILGVEAGKKGE